MKVKYEVKKSRIKSKLTCGKLFKYSGNYLRDAEKKLVRRIKFLKNLKKRSSYLYNSHANNVDVYFRKNTIFPYIGNYGSEVKGVIFLNYDDHKSEQSLSRERTALKNHSVFGIPCQSNIKYKGGIQFKKNDYYENQMVLMHKANMLGRKIQRKIDRDMKRLGKIYCQRNILKKVLL